MVKEPLTYCVLFELPSQRSSAASIWLKRICWVTLFGMRLQKTVNSPTHLSIIQHKQGRDGGNNKAQAHISGFKQQLIIPSPSSHLILLFFLSLLLPNLSLSLANSYLRPSSPPSPPIHSCCLGNNTKRFSSQLCHRGNAWLSSRPLLEARCPPVRSSRLGLTASAGKCWCLCELWRRCTYSMMEGLWLWNWLEIQCMIVSRQAVKVIIKVPGLKWIYYLPEFWNLVLCHSGEMFWGNVLKNNKRGSF